MKVAILARGLSRPGGVSRLVTGYVQSLPAAAPDDEFFVLTDEPLPVPAAPNVTEIRLPRSHAAIFDHFHVPRATKRIAPDVFLATKNTVPLGLSCPVVCVLLDLAYFAMPEAYPRLDNLYIRAMMRRSARLAARLVAISAHTRDDVARYLSREAFDKTRVVYPGVDASFHAFTGDERRAAVERFAELPEWFVLYVGNISPRKNIARLLAASERLEKDVALVLTGHRAWKDDALAEPLAAARRLREVTILGPQSDKDVAALYNLSMASVYPSLYEGFGFPVLESFACGTPVAASSATSIPEVAGDAALLFDAADVDAIARALQRIVSDDGLRRALAAKGLARAREFSWERSAAAMLDVLREVS